MRTSSLQAFLVLAISCGTAWAQPGTPDPSFHDDGLYSQTSDAAFVDTVITTDGRIIGAGWRFLTSSTQEIVLQHFADAAPLSLVRTGWKGMVSAAAAASNGRVVLAGTLSGYTMVAVYRLRSNLTADTTFSGDGKATLTLPSGWSVSVGDVTVDAGGRVLVTGRASFGATRDVFVARFLATGAADTSFAPRGWRTFEVADEPPAFEADETARVVLSDQNEILLAGETESAIGTTDVRRGFVLRLSERGAVLASAILQIKRWTDPDDDEHDSAYALEVAADRLLVGLAHQGPQPDPGGAVLALDRESLDRDGSFGDTSYPYYGAVHTSTTVRGLAALPQSGLAMARVGTGTLQAFSITTGDALPIFAGGSDRVALPLYGGDLFVSDLAVQAGDKVVLSTTTYASPTCFCRYQHDVMRVLMD